MKKVLLILGGFSAIIIILSITFSIKAVFVIKPLYQESKLWIDQTIPMIVNEWNVDAMWANISSELIKETSKGKIKKLFSKLSTELGTLERYDGSVGEVAIRVHNFTKIVEAKYIAKAEFTKGFTEINIRIVKESDTWKISSFYVKLLE